MKGAVLLLLIAGVASASVVGYHIDPVNAAWSGRADPENGVSQTVVACWDSLDRVELFAGANGNGGQYRAGVWLDGAEVMWSWGNRVADHAWIKFEDWDQQVTFTKGMTCEVRFTRGGPDSHVV
jgi:hypothetical protein